MRVCDLEFDRVRRLTTPTSPLPMPAASPSPNPSCHTVWKYYCRDNFGWREYSEVSFSTFRQTRMSRLRHSCPRLISIHVTEQVHIYIFETHGKKALCNYLKSIVSNTSYWCTVTGSSPPVSSVSSAPWQPVVKLIEEASLRGLKEVRFITLQNQYILNIREGFQQNAVFGFRRQIKKRPMFMSVVMLTPHLQ